MAVETMRWTGCGLEIIDQTLLPGELRYVALDTPEAVWEAIHALRVRGAPAIGVCAAYGLLVALRHRPPQDVAQALVHVHETSDYYASSRPTAVNLFWALERMRRAAERIASEAGDADAFFDALLAEAGQIDEEDRARCRAIGEHGAALIGEGHGVLTHCNAGSLATSAFGTALSVMYSAHEQGRTFQVFADETRPLLQGARLTAWELMQAGIDVTLICDHTAAQVMREGKVQLVVVGADRIAANGDTANKIGTYNVAVAARAHGIPFYVAAPSNTFDLSVPNGSGIPIEQRDASEITMGFGKATAPDAVKVYAPAFDVTPADFIAGFITERCILRPPYDTAIAAALNEAQPQVC